MFGSGEARCILLLEAHLMQGREREPGGATITFAGFGEVRSIEGTREGTSKVHVSPRAGSLAGKTSRAHSDRFQSGTGVGQVLFGTNRERSTRWYLWM
jgi:hypothetical protein